MTQLLERIPIAWRVLLGIAAIFTAGWSASALLAETVRLKPRLARVEERLDATEPGIRYLICRAQAQDEGRDPRICAYLLRGIEDQLEDIRRGRRP